MKGKRFSSITLLVSFEEKSGKVYWISVNQTFFCLGEKHISVYASEIKEMSSTNIARLLRDPPKDKVASKPHVKCQENKVFVIDKKLSLFSKPRGLESRWSWRF